jgi:hypothetical protein
VQWRTYLAIVLINARIKYGVQNAGG